LSRTIIAINAGSSSIKATTYELEDSLRALNKLKSIELSPKEGPISETAIDFVERLQHDISGHQPVAIGHRIVYGGPNYNQPIKLADSLVDDLKDYVIFDQEHLPLALRLTELCTQRFPGVDQFACFDTALFHDLPHLAQILPLPQKYQGQMVCVVMASMVYPIHTYGKPSEKRLGKRLLTVGLFTLTWAVVPVWLLHIKPNQSIRPCLFRPLRVSL
jgi:acetate kinase